MTILDATANLKTLGLKKSFKSYLELETGAVRLRTGKAAQILNGVLSGSEIVLRGSELLVWTSQKRKAKALASRYGLRVRLWDGEAEIVVPASLADQLLPMFGARVKREMSPLQVEALNRARAASGLSFTKKPCAGAVSDSGGGSPSESSREGAEGLEVVVRP